MLKVEGDPGAAWVLSPAWFLAPHNLTRLNGSIHQCMIGVKKNLGPVGDLIVVLLVMAPEKKRKCPKNFSNHATEVGGPVEGFPQKKIDKK